MGRAKELTMLNIVALRKRTRINETGSDLVFSIANTTILVLFSLVILYPLLRVVNSSFSSSQAIASGQVGLWPVEFNLLAYEKVFGYQAIWVGYANSLFYTSVGTLVNVFMTIIAAYPLSHRDLPGKGIFLSLFLFTLWFSGGMIPTFLLIQQIGLYNTRWAMIIPNAMTVWNMMIAISFLRTSIPKELYEAAQIDGANDFMYFFKIVLPLSTPLIAVLALFYAVSHWNSFFDALLYLGSSDLYPLQLVLRQILVLDQIDPSMLSMEEYAKRQEIQELIKYAVIVVASLPVMALYPFVQKYFVKGITLGAVKG
jgi:multiple sugar transport system permease protein/putative aldouronate transport system permease protein